MRSSTTAYRRIVTRRAELTAIVVGLVVIVLGAVVVRDGTVPGWERSLFRAINDLPDWLNGPFWPGQLLGWLGVVLIAAVVALLLRQYWLALAIVIVGVVKLVVERVVKAFVTRERPGTSIGSDINARGDVSITGESFVSGHAILSAALATVIAPYVSRRGQYVLGALVIYVMLARVYVGAHNPLDVVCGVGLGVAVGATINVALGAPRRSRAASDRAASVVVD